MKEKQKKIILLNLIIYLRSILLNQNKKHQFHQKKIHQMVLIGKKKKIFFFRRIKLNFRKANSSNDRPQRGINNHYQSLGFSTPPTARRQHLSGFSSLSSTPTRPTTANNYHRYYL